jgi:hypothetical protein
MIIDLFFCKIVQVISASFFQELLFLGNEVLGLAI